MWTSGRTRAPGTRPDTREVRRGRELSEGQAEQTSVTSSWVQGRAGGSGGRVSYHQGGRSLGARLPGLLPWLPHP